MSLFSDSSDSDRSSDAQVAKQSNTRSAEPLRKPLSSANQTNAESVSKRSSAGGLFSSSSSEEDMQEEEDMEEDDEHEEEGESLEHANGELRMSIRTTEMQTSIFRLKAEQAEQHSKALEVEVEDTESRWSSWQEDFRAKQEEERSLLMQQLHEMEPMRREDERATLQRELLDRLAKARDAFSPKAIDLVRCSEVLADANERLAALAWDRASELEQHRLLAARVRGEIALSVEAAESQARAALEQREEQCTAELTAELLELRETDRANASERARWLRRQAEESTLEFHAELADRTVIQGSELELSERSITNMRAELERLRDEAREESRELQAELQEELSHQAESHASQLEEEDRVTASLHAELARLREQAHQQEQEVRARRAEERQQVEGLEEELAQLREQEEHRKEDVSQVQESGGSLQAVEAQAVEARCLVAELREALAAQQASRAEEELEAARAAAAVSPSDGAGGNLGAVQHASWSPPPPPSLPAPPAASRLAALDRVQSEMDGTSSGLLAGIAWPSSRPPHEAAIGEQLRLWREEWASCVNISGERSPSPSEASRARSPGEVGQEVALQRRAVSPRGGDL